MSPSGEAAPALGRTAVAPRHLALVAPGATAGAPMPRSPSRAGAALLVCALGMLSLAAVALTVLAAGPGVPLPTR